jgi:perosamine synthetase
MREHMREKVRAGPMKVPAARIAMPAEDRDWISARHQEILASGQLTLGRYGAEFEQEFARRHRSEYAVSVSSGTSALEIVLRVLGAAGRQVIVPTNTFFATAAAVVHAGGTPRLADIDPSTFGLSVETILAASTPEVRGVIVVHIGGIVSPEMPRVRALCDERGWFLVEDAAHAHGASLDGRSVGTFGHAATFSFYPTKVITSGEGGMIITPDAHVRDEALIYRDQGKESFTTNLHVRLGANWRMSELHAVVGLAQLRRLDEFIGVRTRVARSYDEALLDMPGIAAVPVPDGVRSNYYKYLSLLDEDVDRAALKRLLREHYEVALSGEVYDTPLHKQPVFQDYSEGHFPVANDVCARHVCLSVASDMTERETTYLAEALGSAISTLRRSS